MSASMPTFPAAPERNPAGRAGFPHECTVPERYSLGKVQGARAHIASKTAWSRRPRRCCRLTVSGRPARFSSWYGSRWRSYSSCLVGVYSTNTYRAVCRPRYRGGPRPAMTFRPCHSNRKSVRQSTGSRRRSGTMLRPSWGRPGLVPAISARVGAKSRFVTSRGSVTAWSIHGTRTTRGTLIDSSYVQVLDCNRCSIKVPLVVRVPWIDHAVTEPRLVTNLDFAPTLAEMAGTRPGLPPDGRRMVLRLRREPVDWR